MTSAMFFEGAIRTALFVLCLVAGLFGGIRFVEAFDHRLYFSVCAIVAILIYLTTAILAIYFCFGKYFIS